VSLRIRSATQIFAYTPLLKSVNQRVIYSALAASAVVHALLYWATPHLVSVWNAPSPTRFDAVLVSNVNEPLTSAAVVDASPMPAVAPAKLSKPGTPRTKPTARRTPPVIAITPQVDQSVVSHSGGEIDALKHPELFAETYAQTPPTEPTPEQTREQKPEPAKPAPDPEPVVVAAAATSSRTNATSEVADFKFPTSISIDYKMTSSVANGIANLAWKRKGAEYEIDTSIQATGFFTSMFVGVFRQISRGEVTREGVRPNFFSLQRGEAGADTAEFNRASKELKIIKHGETHLSPLPERMQDMQSFLFQMAHDVAQLKPDQNSIDVQVTNARKVYEYKFRRVGEELVQTRLGALPAIHLKSEATDPEDVYEVWLSPQHFYMPIKLKFFMGRFPIEQVASSVKLSGEDSASNVSAARK
jgi:Protein of unknown function (DUF3108)